MGQSLGGFTAPLVCDQAAVELLVLLAPMIPSPGESPADYWTDTRYEEQVRERYDDPIEPFYQDVPQKRASEALRQGRAQSEVRMGGAMATEGMAGRANSGLTLSRGPLVPGQLPSPRFTRPSGHHPDEIDGGHTPALSRPNELGQRLQAYATQQAGSQFGACPDTRRTGSLHQTAILA